MIKNSAYVREFTPEQKKMLEAIALTQKLKNATDVFLFTLEQYNDSQQEIARLKRLLILKQNKINALKENPAK